MKKSVLSMLPKCIARVPVLRSSRTLVSTMPTNNTMVAAARYPGTALSVRSVHLVPQRFVAFGCNAVRGESRYRRSLLGHLLDDRQGWDGRAQDSPTLGRQLLDEVAMQRLAPVHHREERTNLRLAAVEIVDEAGQLIECADR